MIDFEKEIEKYDYLFETGEADLLKTDIQIESIQRLSEILKRFSKQQLMQNTQIEEIVAGIDDVREDFNALAKKNEDAIEKNNNSLALKESLIRVLDLFENLYHWSKNNSQDPLSISIQRIWEEFKKTMLMLGLGVIDDEQGQFNPQMHNAMQTKAIKEKSHGQVLEVLHCGVIQDGEVKRKAQVVVNIIEE